MTQSEKNIQITFQNGIVSSIDTHVHKLITELQEMVNNQEKLPLFWNLTQSINQYDEIFVKFLATYWQTAGHRRRNYFRTYSFFLC